jgi:type IV secretory pathway VirB10-like protein
MQPWAGLTKKPQNICKTFLHTGFSFDAVLRTAIYSYNTETPVIAIAEYDIIFLDSVVIPKGTKFIGTTSIIKSNDRVNVVFHTAVFPDGYEIPFEALALNTDGSAGIPGKVDKARASIPARVLLEAAGTGASLASPVAGSAVQELSKAAQDDLDKASSYSISVRNDTPILLYIVKRIEY